MVENGVWLSKHLSAWGELVAKSSKCLPNGLFQQPLPRGFGLPSLFKQPLPRVWGLPSIFQQPFRRFGPSKFLQITPFRGYGVSQASFNNPFGGFWAFQASNNPSEAPPKPLRSSLQTTPPRGRISESGFAKETIKPQGQHFCAARQELSEGLVEGRTVTEGVG